MNKPPIVIVTNDYEDTERAILSVYEAGSGDTIVKRSLSAVECMILVERLLGPINRAVRKSNKK